MGARDEPSGDRKRALLTIPVAAVITAMWAAAGLRVIFFGGDIEPWALASVPFGGVWGWVFGGSFIPGNSRR